MCESARMMEASAAALRVSPYEAVREFQVVLGRRVEEKGHCGKDPRTLPSSMLCSSLPRRCGVWACVRDRILFQKGSRVNEGEEGSKVRARARPAQSSRYSTRCVLRASPSVRAMSLPRPANHRATPRRTPASRPHHGFPTSLFLRPHTSTSESHTITSASTTRYTTSLHFTARATPPRHTAPLHAPLYIATNTRPTIFPPLSDRTACIRALSLSLTHTHTHTCARFVPHRSKRCLISSRLSSWPWPTPR